MVTNAKSKKRIYFILKEKIQMIKKRIINVTLYFSRTNVDHVALFKEIVADIFNIWRQNSKNRNLIGFYLRAESFRHYFFFNKSKSFRGHYNCLKFLWIHHSWTRIQYQHLFSIGVIIYTRELFTVGGTKVDRKYPDFSTLSGLI